jgi:hypothetical protein
VRINACSDKINQEKKLSHATAVGLEGIIILNPVYSPSFVSTLISPP